jgi:hypothetical protein
VAPAGRGWQEGNAASKSFRWRWFRVFYFPHTNVQFNGMAADL